MLIEFSVVLGSRDNVGGLGEIVVEISFEMSV